MDCLKKFILVPDWKIFYPPNTYIRFCEVDIKKTVSHHSAMHILAIEPLKCIKHVLTRFHFNNVDAKLQHIQQTPAPKLQSTHTKINIIYNNSLDKQQTTLLFVSNSKMYYYLFNKE